ncbi:MAG: hypothetical protein Phog2KO_48920 [Phototrophicaceae bacterium]
MNSRKKLENLSREELLATVRQVLAEADALSSRISAVNEIGVAMNATLSLDKILKVVAKQAKWLMDFEHCSICLQGDTDWEIVSLFGQEIDSDINFKESKTIQHIRKYRYPKLVKQGNESDFLKGFDSQIIIPLIADNTLLGTINFAMTQAEAYTQDDMRIGYMLSLQISPAIRNARIVKQLKLAQEQLEMRIADLDTYNHMIAHDLKSPLSAILLSSQLLQMRYAEALPEKAQGYLHSIEDSTNHMNSMIDKLLWLARLRHNQDPFQTVDMNACIYQILPRFEMPLQEKNIELVIQENLPNAIGQTQWVEEVFANLISNAIKYMGTKDTAHKIEVLAEIKDDEIVYKVIDTGIGVKEENLNALFEMFKRVEGTNVEGTGMGLSIVKRIVRRMNGKFGVESVYGEGSTFWFSLNAPESKN